MIRFALIFSLFTLAVLPAEAAPINTKAKLEKVQSQLNQQQEKAAALDEKAQETTEDLNALRGKLIKATESLQVKSQELNRLQENMGDLQEDIEAKKETLIKERKKLKGLTSAMISLSRRPPETLFLQSGLTMDHIHRAVLLRDLTPRIQEQAQSLAHDLEELQNTENKMAAHEKLLAAAQKNLEWQQHSFDQLIKTRQGLLQKTEEQKTVIAKQLVSLSSEAKNLRELLDKVSPQSRKPSLPPVLQPGLKWPVAGKVVRDFGAKDGDGVVSQGLTFAGLSGGPVVAPRTGKVVFVGPFKGYGEIVILQHEGNYHSLLAGFGRIDTDLGEDVAAGEPLGVLPVKTAGKPELYFEWRRNNEAVDPTAGITLSKK